MRIALDAMGGDHAPEPVVAGAVLAVNADPELRVVLVGDQAQVEPALKKASGPKVGLMNVGAEEAKGNELARDTHALFNASQLRENFLGNIEGRDIHRGVA